MVVNKQAAREEAMSAVEVAREAEVEVKALRTMTHRMILTQEEMVSLSSKAYQERRTRSFCFQM